jgi:type IV fimbrial biogenesis protein FimT
MRRAHGITAIELMITIAVVAILSAIAAPSFTNLRYQGERVSQVNDFLHAIFLARSEAIKRGHAVELCKSRDGTSCSSTGHWHDGWIVFVNTDREDVAERDPGEEVLLVHPAWKTGTITSNRNSFSFRPYRQAVVNGTVVFCDPRGSEHARAIIVSSTGRPRLSHRDSSNRPLVCPAR